MYSVPGLIPGTRDYGITENKLVQALLPNSLYALAKSTQNPRIGQVQGASTSTPNNGLENYNFGTNKALNITPTWEQLDAQLTPQNGGTQNGGIQGGNDGGSPAQEVPQFNFEDVLNRQRSAAQELYNRAQGIYDEGMANLANKRSQFDQTYKQGQSDILQGYEKGRGELQASSQGSRQRNSNALRALGLGGSAVVRSQGRQQQQEAKQLGNLQDQRQLNERQNTSAYQTNQDWANAQQSSLDRYLADAGAQQSYANNNIVDNVSSLFQNILNNQAQVAAATGNYQVNPYQVNIDSFLNSLNGITDAQGVNGGQQENAGVNIDPNQSLSYLDRLKKNLGTLGAGLYVN